MRIIFDQAADQAHGYGRLLTKLLRERLYDSACLFLSDRKTGKAGGYREPSAELSLQNFATSLLARAIATVRAR